MGLKLEADELLRGLRRCHVHVRLAVDVPLVHDSDPGLFLRLLLLLLLLLLPLLRPSTCVGESDIVFFSATLMSVRSICLKCTTAPCRLVSSSSSSSSSAPIAGGSLEVALACGAECLLFFLELSAAFASPTRELPQPF